MAIVKGPFQITGAVGELSFYTCKGDDRVRMRAKGGASAKKIKNNPEFASFRKQQKEWSGVAKQTAGVRMAFGDLLGVADYNLIPALNALHNKMQKADTSAEKGRRPVCLSNYREALNGFNFNRKLVLNSVLRVPVSFDFNREALEASVQLPTIHTKNELSNDAQLPYVRFVVVLGSVSDMQFDEPTLDYLPTVPALHGAVATVHSAWMPTMGVIDEQHIQVKMTAQQQKKCTDKVSVFLSMGLEFGTVGIDGLPTQVKYTGCGKVLKVF